MSGAAGRRVLFICDFGPGFDGAAYHGAGVGGTEAAVVLLAEAMVADGAEVEVATTSRTGSRYAGVTYVPLANLDSSPRDLAILVKVWSDAAPDKGRVRLFLMSDVHVPHPENIARCRAWADRSIAMSDYQRRRVEAVTGRGWLRVMGLPIGYDDYREPASVAAAREHVLIYCSIPDRGLYYLQHIFPAVRRRVPDARLVITSDFTLWGMSAANEAFLRFFEGQAGVEYLGHVPRERLVAEQNRARVMAYPCTFEEGFCLSAAECMAAGAVPVTTNAFALTTTVDGAGVLVRGRPRSWFYRRTFVNATVRLLTDDGYWSERSRACRERAYSYRPARVAADVIALAREAGL